MQDVSLYIHWPFCLSKCPYCDFNSHVRDFYGESMWKDAIIDEILLYKKLLGERKLKTIFFGGGTPSLMMVETVASIINAACRAWEFDKDLEVTLEANPNSVEIYKFEGLAKAGVNRISIGVQSLRVDRLESLGRNHSIEEAKKAIEVAKKFFKRVSFDLIYATPNQSAVEWAEELDEALSFGTEHLSLYQLAIEPDTVFAKLHARGKLPMPADDLSADLYEITEKMCLQNNLHLYEVSNYAKLGMECLHNMNYWNYGEYIGVGPGAHGRVVINGKRYATTQHKVPEKWIKAPNKNAEKLELSDEEINEERLIMGLRTKVGVKWSRKIEGRVEFLIKEDFLQFKDGHLKTTSKGRLALQSVLGYMLV